MTEGGSTADADLVRQVQEGSEAALEALYRRYLPSVWRYVCTRLDGDRQAAEDVVSETFLAAIRSVKTLDPGGGAVCGWLMGIARHKLGDHWRRIRRGRREPGGLRAEQAGPSDPTGPQDALAATETAAQVAKTMAALPDEQRLALEWKYVDELSVRETAERLGRTEKAVEALLYRARRSFRAVFESLTASAE